MKIVIFTMILNISVFAQEIIDLSSIESLNKVEVNIEKNKDFSLKIINKLPYKKYFITVNSIRINVPALQLQTENPKSIEIEPELVCIDLITSLANIIDGLKKLDEEKDLHENMNRLNDKLTDALNESKCKDDMRLDELLKESEKIKNEVTKTVDGPFKLAEFDKLNVEITREDGKKWEITYKTNERGIWLISYGIAYISNIFGQHKEFIPKKINSDTTRVGVYEKSKGEGDKAVVIFYSWLPLASVERDVAWGFTMGVGTDFKEPIAFAGINFTYNWNLNIILGGVIRNIKRPNETYKLDQDISASEVENLNRNTVGISPFVAFTFRFGENPFTK